MEQVEIKIKDKKHKKMNFNMWGYIFLIPFFVAFIIFQFIPLFQTLYYSFFEYYFKLGINQVGPNFVFLKNFQTLLGGTTFWKYLGNTLIIWVIGAIPQFVIALLLAVIFTDARLKLKCQGFFKAIIYMPNLVMAAAFGMLFLMLFAYNGPISIMLRNAGLLSDTFKFIESKWWVRGIIAFISFLMWVGNTTILLMSGILGIDDSVFESARLDGAGSFRTFKDITLPLLMPIFIYVLITSMIGGIQLFDAAQIFTETSGGPDLSSETLLMYLYTLINTSKNYGLAGALSVIIFIITGVLSFAVFKVLAPSYSAIKAEKVSYKKRMRWLKYRNKDVEATMSYEPTSNN